MILALAFRPDRGYDRNKFIIPVLRKAENHADPR
jgi:hypothetical protein